MAQKSKFSSNTNTTSQVYPVPSFDDDTKRKFLTRGIECALPEEDQVANINCIIFGEAGSGKSSFVNTCYWSVFPELIDNEGIAQINDEAHHGTRVITYYKIGEHLSLIDTKGLTTFTDEAEAIKVQLGGKAVHGKEVAKTEKKTWGQWLRGKKGKVDFFDCVREGDIHTMPHCVLIIIAADQDVPPGIRMVLEIIQAQKIPVPVLFLLSKVDKVSPEDLVRQKKQLILLFGASFPEVESRIVEIKNYTGMKNQKLDSGRTTQALNILMQARTLAHSFITQKVHAAESRKEIRNPLKDKFRLKALRDENVSWIASDGKYCALKEDRLAALVFIQSPGSPAYKEVQSGQFLRGCSSTWFLHQWITCNSTSVSSWETFYQVPTHDEGIFLLKNESSGYVYADASGFLRADGTEHNATRFQLDYLIE